MITCFYNCLETPTHVNSFTSPVASVRKAHLESRAIFEIGLCEKHLVEERQKDVRYRLNQPDDLFFWSLYLPLWRPESATYDQVLAVELLVHSIRRLACQSIP